MKQIHVINITGIHIPEDEWADTSIKLHIGNTKEEIEIEFLLLCYQYVA